MTPIKYFSTINYDNKTKKVLLEAIDSVCNYLYNNGLFYDILLLYSLYNTDNKSGLSVLHLTNIYNFVINSDGSLKKIKTKAWNKSRKRKEQLKTLVKNKFKELYESKYGVL